VYCFPPGGLLYMGGGCHYIDASELPVSLSCLFGVVGKQYVKIMYDEF